MNQIAAENYFTNTKCHCTHNNPLQKWMPLKTIEESHDYENIMWLLSKIINLINACINSDLQFTDRISFMSCIVHYKYELVCIILNKWANKMYPSSFFCLSVGLGYRHLNYTNLFLLFFRIFSIILNFNMKPRFETHLFSVISERNVSFHLFLHFCPISALMSIQVLFSYPSSHLQVVHLIII